MATSLMGEAWLRPLDRARTALFVRALRVPPLRPVLLEKQRRVPALLLVHAAVALVLAVLAPTLLLVVGPLLLGVPHLVADVRFLVLRPRWTRATRAWLFGGVLLLLALRVVALGGFTAPLRYELALAASWIGGAAVLGTSRFRDARFGVVVAAVAGLGLVGWLRPSGVRLVLAHGHNLVALLVWGCLFCAQRRRALVVTVAVVGASALLLLTPLAQLGFSAGLTRFAGLHAFAAAEQLAPFAESSRLALGVVASFAFLQSVHYAVWLHAIPQEETRGEGTLSEVPPIQWTA